MIGEWQPFHIDIERTFTDFVCGFRDGCTVSEIVGTLPPSVLNADFVFKEDNVIAELKCLEKDAGHSNEMQRRLVKSAKHFGHTDQEIAAFFTDPSVIPERVMRRYKGMITRPIVDVCKKAIKQIRSTKELLKMPAARGIVLVANDNNYGLTPHDIMLAISRCINEHGRGIVEVAVYFTPNVYHDDDTGDGIAKTFWVPTYNLQDDEEPSEGLQEFVNDLGRSWLNWHDQIGDPSVTRYEAEDITSVMTSTPVPALGRAGRP